MKKPSEVYDIIYNTLEPYLTPKELTTAINIWEEKYSHLTQLRLSTFIGEIGGLGSVKENRHPIYRLITKQLLENESNTPSFVDKPKQASSPLTNTFVLFAKHMLAEMRSDQQTVAISHVQTLLQSKKVGVKDIQTLINALRTNAQAQCEIPTKLLRQSINQIYMVMCELLGPVKADQILNRAVSLVTEEAKDINKLI